MAGTVQERDRIYSIRHMGGPIYAMVEMSEERMPQEHAPMPARLRTDDPNLRDDPLVKQGDASMLRPVTPACALPQPARRRRSSRKPIVGAASGAASRRTSSSTCIVAYTQKAAANYTDIKRELVDLAIEEANESFRMSGLGNIKLRLVHAYQTDYVEEGAHFDHVWRFADKGDGYMEEIHGLRDKYRADVAVLIVDDSAGLRAGDARLRRRRRGVRRRASRVRGADLHRRARDRPPHRRAPRSRHGQDHDARSPTATATSTAPSGATS